MSFPSNQESAAPEVAGNTYRFIRTANSRPKVVIIGLGDLGRRIALGLARNPGACNIVLAGRSRQTGEAMARLVSACGAIETRFVPIDALDKADLARLIETERPDLVVQSASLLSPWALHERTDEYAHAVRTAGFALQLSAQLPAIAGLMAARRDSRAVFPVVNCSYPDATNPILAAHGLAPTIGVGNAGMLLGLARAAFAHDTRRLRLLAHHAHVGAVTLCDRSLLGEAPAPLLFADDAPLADQDLLFSGAPIPATRELNALSAAHALSIIDALLPGGAQLHTSAPGPFGLPGGWPVRIADGRVELDLPDSAGDPSPFLPFQQAAARKDGIEAIDTDGTVHYTDRVQAALPAALRHLAQPLTANTALARYRELVHALAI